MFYVLTFHVFAPSGFHVGSKASLEEAEALAVRRSRVMGDESTVKEGTVIVSRTVLVDDEDTWQIKKE